MLECLTIKTASELLRKREISSVELTRAYLERAKEKNQELNAYLAITETEALKMAEHADKHFKADDVPSPLCGIPIAIKDNILIEGIPATAASKILQNYTAAYDATATKRLRDAKAVFLGKTNLDEFAMGSSTENSAFGPTKNPLDVSRVPGGSSGGSAAAVAADLCLGALGSDTGGSIRQPAGFCGITGLKPTYGRVSRSGLIAMASSLDQIGPMAKNAWDAAALLEVIAGHDPLDATTATHEAPRYTTALTGEIRGLRIGVPREYFSEGLDEDVRRAVRGAVGALERLGASVTEVSLPHSTYALAVYYVLMPSEVSANLARFDGIRYGYSSRTAGAQTLLDVYEQSRGEGFGDEVRRRIMLGTYALSSGYYEAYYVKAQKVRTLILQDFEKVFSRIDVLVGPTSPTPAFRLGERKKDPLSMYLADIYTVPANIAGIPALTIPCGFVERDGIKLPVGLQILAKHFDEATVLRIADTYERFAKTAVA